MSFCRASKMRSKSINLLILNAFIGLTVIGARTATKDNELEVRLQFLEYELEDYCVAKNDAEWNFLAGTKNNLTKLLDVELQESEFYRQELKVVQQQTSKKFESEKLLRLIDIFSHPGAPLLGKTEFREYRDYSIKLYEMMGTMNLSRSKVAEDTNLVGNESPNITYNTLNSLLFRENNNDYLKRVWTEWFEEVGRKNKKTKYDFVQQLSILDLEAEQNGEEELSEYWLKMSDATNINYDSVKHFWNSVSPLYKKLKHFMVSLIFMKFGKDVFPQDDKMIPVHILGSTTSYDWVTAAEKLGAFEDVDAYREMKSLLARKNVEGIYRMIDNATPEYGSLFRGFYENSRFNESSLHCQNRLNDYCGKNHVMKVMVCNDESNDNLKIRDFLEVVKNTIKMKYLTLSAREEDENGFLMREGPRDSTLYEAIQGSFALRFLRPDNLQRLGLLTSRDKEKQELLSLIISALHVLPPLPYYLASDLWRINTLREIDSSTGENEMETTVQPATSSASKYQNASLSSGETYDSMKTYGVGNLTFDWWKFRKEYQEIGSPNGKPYEDYLQDLQIIWNKPYISKFLGVLLQFQIMEHLAAVNQSQESAKLETVMRKGKSKPWQVLAEENFGISEISVDPLLRYFKPLEDFLEKGIKFQHNMEIFTAEDYNFSPQSSSYKPRTQQGESGEQPGETSDSLFFSFVAIAAIGIIAIIVTIGRRRHKKRQKIAERKRRLADL